MLTKRNASAAESTGRSLSYQGQQSPSTTRQMCLPLSLSSASEDGRKIRQITKQNSFHEDQTGRYSGPQLVDRRYRNAPPMGYHPDSSHNRVKTAMPLRVPVGGGGGGGGGPPPMSTSWTSGGDGPVEDVPGSPWRQFRNSDRSLRCAGQGLSSAKFASSIELSLDNDGAGKGGEPHPHTATLFASSGSSVMGGAGRGAGVGRGGVDGGNIGAETGRFFYQSPSPGTQTELARIFEGPTRAPPYLNRSGEGVQDPGTQRTLVMNGTVVLPPGPLETPTAGSYPELHNIAYHESRRGSLPAPRKLDETGIVMRVRKESPYENSSPSLNRQRNEHTLNHRSNGNGNHQNGNGKTSTTTFHDGNSFKSSSDGNSFLNACDGKRFWSAHNGTTVPGRDRYDNTTTRENIYEEIDSSSLRSSKSGHSMKVFI